MGLLKKSFEGSSEKDNSGLKEAEQKLEEALREHTLAKERLKNVGAEIEVERAVRQEVEALTQELDDVRGDPQKIAELMQRRKTLEEKLAALKS